MKSLVVALLTLTMSLAHSQVMVYYPKLTYQELMSLNYSYESCPYLDKIVNYLEYQQRHWGVYNVPPEALNNSDRLVNLRLRALIWGLRVDCSNPNRYKK
jgi:hypothetical protein